MQGLPSNFRTIRFDGRSSGADFAILLPVKSRNSSWLKYRKSNIFSIMLCCRARNFKLGICTKASSDICNSLLYYRNTVVSFVNFNSKSRISGPKFKKPNLKVFRFCAHRSLSGLHRKFKKDNLTSLHQPCPITHLWSTTVRTDHLVALGEHCCQCEYTYRLPLWSGQQYAQSALLPCISAEYR